MKYSSLTVSTLLIEALLHACAPPVLAFSPNKLHRAAVVLIESSTVASDAFAKKRMSLQLSSARIINQSSCSMNNHPRSLTILDATVIEDIDGATTALPAASKDVNEENVIAKKSSSSTQGTIELLEREEQLLRRMEAQAAAIVDEMIDDTCEVDPETGAPVDEICVDEEKKRGFRATVKSYIKSIGSLVVGQSSECDSDVETMDISKPKKVFTGDALERGCKLFDFVNIKVGECGLKMKT